MRASELPPPMGQPAVRPRVHFSVGSTSSRSQRDAREVLDEHQAEHARVRIECHRHRRREVGGADPYAVGQAALDYGGGCLAFTPALRQVQWPRKFHPGYTGTYDGASNPREFLQIYSTAMVAAGADDKVMANWFPMALRPAVRSWLMNLPEKSVASWADLCDQFVSAFQGGYRRLGTTNDLHLVIQGPEERLRSFRQRFS